jgi:hypothetical protein
MLKAGKKRLPSQHKTISVNHDFGVQKRRRGAVATLAPASFDGKPSDSKLNL